MPFPKLNQWWRPQCIQEHLKFHEDVCIDWFDNFEQHRRKFTLFMAHLVLFPLQRCDRHNLPPYITNDEVVQKRTNAYYCPIEPQDSQLSKLNQVHCVTSPRGRPIHWRCWTHWCWSTIFSPRQQTVPCMYQQEFIKNSEINKNILELTEILKTTDSISNLKYLLSNISKKITQLLKMNSSGSNRIDISYHSATKIMNRQLTSAIQLYTMTWINSWCDSLYISSWIYVYQ